MVSYQLLPDLISQIGRNLFMKKANRKVLKSLIAVAVVLCMLFSIAPVQAFAVGRLSLLSLFRSIGKVSTQTVSSQSISSENDTFYGVWRYRKLLSTKTEEYSTPAAFFSAMGSADKGTFYLYSDCTMPSNATVPSGVTLLLPYNADDTKGYAKGDTGNATYRESWSDPSTYLYHTLTIPSGKTLTVNGSLMVGGIYGYPDQSPQGHTSGAYSQIQLEGTINVSGTMDVYGLVKGSGTVNVNNGGELLLPFIFNDFVGGTNSTNMNDAGIFPFNQFALNNVQAKCVMNYGCTVTGHGLIYFHTLGTFTDKDVTIVSSSEGALVMGAGSKITATYDETKKVDVELVSSGGSANLVDFGKLTLEIAGNVTAGSIKISYTIYTFNSGDVVLSVPYTFDAVVKSGTFNVPNKYRIMPGCTMTFEKGSTLNLTGELQVVDGWEQGALSGKRYPTSAQMAANGFSQSGNLIINGTMNIQSGAKFAGIIQTTDTTSTAKVVVNSGATLGGTFSTGIDASSVTYTLPARVYTGTALSTITTGKTYTAYADDSWTLPSYTMNVNGTTKTITINETMHGKFCSHNYTSVVTAPTCTQRGYTTFTCSACGDSYVSNYTSALGHASVTDPAVPATCTEPGLSEGSHCSRCNEVIVAQEVVPALGHDPVTDPAVPATCSSTGLTEGSHCSRCNEVLVAQEVVPALEHNPVIDPAVPATCTETGLTEGSHCSNCNEVLVAQQVVPALGHDPVVDPAVPATCTETGLTEGSHCSRCNEVLVAQQVVPALGHNYGTEVTFEWTEDAGAEFGWTATAYRTCTRCTEKLYANVSIARTGITEITATASFSDGVTATDVKNIEAVSVTLSALDPNTIAVNNDAHIIYGIPFEQSDMIDYITVSDSSATLAYSTGPKGNLTAIDVYMYDSLVATYKVVVLGDLNGDGSCDGMDYVIAECIRAGMITEANYGADYAPMAVAADIDADGVVSELDTAAINDLGLAPGLFFKANGATIRIG